MRAGWIGLTFVVFSTACGIVAKPAPAPVRQSKKPTPIAVCRPWTTSKCMVQVGASLRGEQSGRPVAGKRVRFLAGRAVICESVTDRSGHASCGGVAPNGRAIAEEGYEVVFEGDRWYRAARARTE